MHRKITFLVATALAGVERFTLRFAAITFFFSRLFFSGKKKEKYTNCSLEIFLPLISLSLSSLAVYMPKLVIWANFRDAVSFKFKAWTDKLHELIFILIKFIIRVLQKDTFINEL